MIVAGPAVAVAQQRGGEGQEHDEEQEDEVADEHLRARGGHHPQVLVVQQPEAPDHREAQEEREELVLQREQVLGDLTVLNLGLGQRQDQQRDRDGEDAVAERLDPVEGRRWWLVLVVHHRRPLTSIR